MTVTEKFENVKNCMQKARDDPRMSAVHISIYVALICMTSDDNKTLRVFSHEVMPLCKISGVATYHRCIRELDAFGYIKYFPSYNQYKGSRVEFVFDGDEK
jgi:hypothetical protein